MEEHPGAAVRSVGASGGREVESSGGVRLQGSAFRAPVGTHCAQGQHMVCFPHSWFCKRHNPILKPLSQFPQFNNLRSFINAQAVLILPPF